MWLIELFIALIRDLWAGFLLSWLEPAVHEVDPDDGSGSRDENHERRAEKLDDDGHVRLERTTLPRHLVPLAIVGLRGPEEIQVTDSFLSQLEQRTQQVKITLANLEAEK